jgi:hypothetical protein
MQTLTAIASYFLAIIYAIGQDVRVERSTEKNLRISPREIYSVKEFSDSSSIGIKLIELHTVIGPHPEFRGQEVVLSDLLLLVKERSDDRPDASTDYWVRGQFYNPRDFRFNKLDKSLTFKHGTEKNSEQ